MMKKYFYGMVCCFLIQAALLNKPAIAQTLPDTNRQKQVDHVRQKLDLSEDKAKQVANIDEQYKILIKSTVSNTALSDKEKRLKYDELRSSREHQLNQILTPVQLEKISGAIYQKDGQKIKLLIMKLDINEEKAKQVIGIQEEYKKNIRMIISQIDQTPESRKEKFDAQTADEYKKLSSILNPTQLANLTPPQHQLNNKLQLLPTYSLTAAQDTFERKLKKTLNNKRLSAQERQSRIDTLLKERKQNLNKDRGKSVPLGNN
jgi:hypothetical protein